MNGCDTFVHNAKYSLLTLLALAWKLRKIYSDSRTDVGVMRTSRTNMPLVHVHLHSQSSPQSWCSNCWNTHTILLLPPTPSLELLWAAVPERGRWIQAQCVIHAVLSSTAAWHSVNITPWAADWLVLAMRGCWVSWTGWVDVRSPRERLYGRAVPLQHALTLKWLHTILRKSKRNEKEVNR